MRTRKIVLAGLFTAITAITAQISIPIPFSPVPLTLQVLAVCLAGGILGATWGSVSQLVYLLLGAFGVPVFAQARGGLNVILGPTGGYTIGFVLAAFVIGWISDRNRVNYKNTLLAMFCGLVLIYLVGTVQLALILGLTWQKALVLGVGWFLPFDLLKVLIGARLSVAIRRVLFWEITSPGHNI